MGRGLSDLQKTMLVMARANRLAEGLKPIEYEVRFDQEDFEPEFGEDHATEEARLRWAGRRHLLRSIGFVKDDEATAAEWRERLTRAGHPDRPFYGELLSNPLGHPPYSIVPGIHVDPDEARVVADRGNAAGVKSWFNPVSYAFSDLYQWEILGIVYGFNEHRKLSMGNRLAATHYPDYAELREKMRLRPRPQWVEDRIKDRTIDEPSTPGWVLALEDERSNRRMPCHDAKLFDRAAIGEKRYSAARVATSKGFLRLQERGLALVWGQAGSYPGLRLTSEGMAEAERLSANSGNVIRTVSR